MDAEQWRARQRQLREAMRSTRRTQAGSSGPQVITGSAAPVEGAVPFASVIVVCWNAAEVLGRCLEQLLAQDYPCYEIIVVDDSSRDGTLAAPQAAAARGG